MTCKICGEHLFKTEVFSHYWEKHRDIMIQRIQEGKSKQKHFVHKNVRPLTEFF